MIDIFINGMLRSLLESYQHFRGTNCL